ncbi:uncharacterized protein DUF455 [Paenibacillus taihuensis]|uniref:Uncharacterized protein DUF455 n=1 Tax=Paenibacillus taihuensis TaxID=1156355 RepID=A0A3D9RNK4_9BACL|nr:DUF455 family protein [Paenibacillus taihuensis]REE77699.1 uncharacterized protein DUF455 [Paenibacillus taihuensis]
MEEKVIVMGEAGRKAVDDASAVLKRLYYTERECMRTLGGYLVSVSDWELKKKLPYHIWQDSLRADALRSRVLELRYPRRDVDQDHDEALTQYLQQLIRSLNDAELIVGVYFVTKQALAEAYDTYLTESDPLDDAPTYEFMRRFSSEIHAQLDEIRAIYDALPEVISNEDHTRTQALSELLQEIGGLFGTEASKGPVSISEALVREPYTAPLVPARDPRFRKAIYHMPPVEWNTFLEHQIWGGINHVNEIWAAEVPGTVLWKWDDMPWEFYLETARWCFDESRHCMMGEQRMKAWGFRTGIDFPVVGDHYESVSHMGELALLCLLHDFETNGPGLKSTFKAKFEKMGDTASSQDFDYDWADESIHLQYGYKWCLHRLGGDNDKLEDLKDEVRETWNAWIEQAHQRWDYEPFLSELRQKIVKFEAMACE